MKKTDQVLFLTLLMMASSGAHYAVDSRNDKEGSTKKQSSQGFVERFSR